MQSIWILGLIMLIALGASFDAKAAEPCGLEAVRAKTAARIVRHHGLEFGNTVTNLNLGETEVSRGRHEEYWEFEVYYTYTLQTLVGENRFVNVQIVGRDTYDDRCALRETGWKKVTPVAN